MSLNQHPVISNSSPRKNFLPRSLLLALSLALAACDKQEAPIVSQVKTSPVVVPTGAITDILINTSDDFRRELVRRVVDGTLGATGQDFYTRGFARDTANLSTEHVEQLDVGFGPQRGTHVVTVRQEGGKTYRNDMFDADNDGNVNIVEDSVSWPIKRNDTSIPMTHSEKSYVVDANVHDRFATALHHALTVLEKEKQLPKK